jgi:hypothetical protein
MYVADPAAVLKTHAAALAPGGIVVPIEFDITSAGAVPSTPTVERALSWILDAFARVGIHTALGPRLWNVAREAGLQPRGMLAVQPYFGPGDANGARCSPASCARSFPCWSERVWRTPRRSEWRRCNSA